MRNLILALIGLGAWTAAHATPVTFTDTYNPTDVFLSNSGTNIYEFTHNILDNGYTPGLFNITSADIFITMADDGDRSSENVRISLDGSVIASSLSVTSGTRTFSVNSNLLKDDGLLVVRLNVLSGDFYFQQSTLAATATAVEAPVSAPAAVPEPGTLALTGLGILGLGWAARRKRA